MLKHLISSGVLLLVRKTPRIHASKVLSSRNFVLNRPWKKDKETVVEETSYIKATVLSNQHDGFNEFYRFPYIRVGHYLHKLKWYQTLATVAAVPISSLLCLAGKISLAETEAVIITGVFLTVNLHVWAALFHEAVGFMYLSEDKKTVRISYLNLWGNRVNQDFTVDEIMPISDAPNSYTDVVFRKVFFYTTNSPKPKIFLSIRSVPLGKITDEESFVKVFGSYKS